MQKEMEYILSLHPKYLGRRLQDTIKTELSREVEGKYFPSIGYVLIVLSIPYDAGVGLIDPNTGFAEFKIKYYAIVYAPIDNEVTYCIVTQVTPVFLSFCDQRQNVLTCKFGIVGNIVIALISFCFF